MKKRGKKITEPKNSIYGVIERDKEGKFFASILTLNIKPAPSAGHIQNNRTGEVLKWKAKGYSLSEQEKARLQADSATANRFLLLSF